MVQAPFTLRRRLRRGPWSGALRDSPELTRPVVKAAAVLAPGQPLQIDTLQILATFADRQGMLAEAETLYRECIKLQLPPATEPLIYGSMLQVLWKARHYEAVVDMCRTGLKQTQACNRVLLRAELARALGQLQRWKEALGEVDQAVREAGDGEVFLVRSLRIRLLMQADKTAAAESECKALMEEQVARRSSGGALPVGEHLHEFESAAPGRSGAGGLPQD